MKFEIFLEILIESTEFSFGRFAGYCPRFASVGQFWKIDDKFSYFSTNCENVYL